MMSERRIIPLFALEVQAALLILIISYGLKPSGKYIILTGRSSQSEKE
jgi:hypothetical protein